MGRVVGGVILQGGGFIIARNTVLDCLKICDVLNSEQHFSFLKDEIKRKCCEMFQRNHKIIGKYKLDDM